MLNMINILYIGHRFASIVFHNAKLKTAIKLVVSRNKGGI